MVLGVNNTLHSEFAKLNTKFDAITSREQIMVLICGFMLLGIVLHMLLLEPQLLSNNALKENIELSQNESQSLVQQTQELSQALQLDPNLPVNTRIAELQLQIMRVEQQLALYTANLVPANQMPRILENVLASSSGLKVISLQSIPPTPVLKVKENDSVEQYAAEALYRHGVKLIVEGQYFDIQRYLARLEALDWQFYWKKFDYKVGEYPLAVVELEIYTLSTNKAFIGV
jgi:MSHA biogenesis protein MshJ